MIVSIYLKIAYSYREEGEMCVVTSEVVIENQVCEAGKDQNTQPIRRGGEEGGGGGGS